MCVPSPDLPRYRAGSRVPTGDPPVGELVEHEKNVGLEDVDVVEVVADGARQRRLADLLQLRERQGAATVHVVAVLVPESDLERKKGLLPRKHQCALLSSKKSSLIH